jgi:hypothetical protein
MSTTEGSRDDKNGIRHIVSHGMRQLPEPLKREVAIQSPHNGKGNLFMATE